MANSSVPKFGAWEGNESAAYTMYFEHARKNKNQGHLGKPHESQLNQDMLPQQNPTARNDLQIPKEGGRLPFEPRHKPVGSDIERSPLHPRAVRREGGGSPFNSKNSSDSAHGMPGRSRPTAGSFTPDRHPSVPEFGVWEKDPAQADNFTSAFELVSKEKKGEATPTIGGGQSRVDASKKYTNNGVKCCCFWF